MDSSVLTILSVILALAGTICMFIMILPEKARPGLNPFLKYIHDLFNFKVLWLEQILKFIYTPCWFWYSASCASLSGPSTILN